MTTFKKIRTCFYTTIILLFVTLSNSSAEDKGEVIVVVGQRIINPIIPQMLEGFGNGLRWMNDLSTRATEASALLLIQERQKCYADADANVLACQDAVTTGALSLGGIACYSAGGVASLVASYFSLGTATTPVVTLVSIACGGIVAISSGEALQACFDAGEAFKSRECEGG